MNTPSQPTEAASVSRKYTRRSEAQWRVLIDNFEQSGLTLDAYCQYHNIAPSGFYTWRKRFQSESEKDTGENTFIDITPQVNATAVTAKQPGNTSWQVELVLDHGGVLRIKMA